jgi:hypothetical protein
VVQRFYKIIVAFCLVVYGTAVSAQENQVKVPQVSLLTSSPLIKYSVHPGRKLNPAFTLNVVNERKTGQVAEVLKNRAVTARIGSNFYTENFGFVCKKELQLEKMTRIPFRFRLGSLEYCDYLENK